MISLTMYTRLVCG